MSATRRLFLGIDLDDATRSLLAQMLQPIGPLPGKLSPPENWHITIRYLGDVDEVLADRLLADLDQQEWPGPFKLTLSGLEAFPDPERATVLWVGVRSVAAEEVAARVEEIAVELGFAPEERPFVPHLTVSRIRQRADVSELVDVDWGSLSLRVDELTLFETVPTTGPNAGPPTSGVRYEVVDRITM